MLRKAFGVHPNNLKEIRLKKGLSQAQLGNIVDVQQQTVYYWENNINPMPVVIAVRLSKALKVPAARILGIDRYEKREEADGRGSQEPSAAKDDAE